MPATVTTQLIYAGVLPDNTPTDSGWFSGANLLFFTSPDVGEYLTTNELLEVNASLIVEMSPGTERIIWEFKAIDTAGAVAIPSAYRNDCFRMKVCFQPSFGFALNAFALICENDDSQLEQCCQQLNTKLDLVLTNQTAMIATQAVHTFELGVLLANGLAQDLLLTGMATVLALPASVSIAIEAVIAYLTTRALPLLP